MIIVIYVFIILSNELMSMDDSVCGLISLFDVGIIIFMIVLVVVYYMDCLYVDVSVYVLFDDKSDFIFVINFIFKEFGLEGIEVFLKFNIMYGKESIFV